MKKVAMIPLALGLLIGGIAIKLGLDTLQEAKAGARRKIITTVVAIAEIPATSIIEASMIKTVETPETPLLGKGYFTEAEKVVGRVPAYSIAQGVVLRESLLSPPGTPPGLAVRIQPGMRAVTVKVNEVTGVAYQIQPGARVDVIAVMAVVNREGTRETVSRIILQDVEVGAVGRTLQASSQDGKGRASKSVTLLVKSTDAPRLHLAQTRGKLTLALRSGDDNEIAEAHSATESELLGIFAEKPAESEKPAAEPRKPSFSQGRDITVVHGSHIRIHRFGDQGVSITTVGGAVNRRSGEDDMDSRRGRGGPYDSDDDDLDEADGEWSPG
ncbi:MAG: Flp pilus assembly protein CpaB [Phycisphaerae bacterium]